MQPDGKLVPVLLLFAFVVLTAATQIIAKMAVKQLNLADGAGGVEIVATLARFLVTPQGLLILVGTFAGGCCYLLALSRLPLSYAYPFVAMSFPVVTFASWWFFGEPLSWQNIVAIGLITAGLGIHAVA